MSGSQPSSSIPAAAPVPKHSGGEEADSMSKECKDLMSALPKVEERWVSRYLYQYEDFWHYQFSLQGTLTCQNHFVAHDTDIILATTPKSGTTWLKALMYALVSRPQICLNLEEGHPLVTRNPHDLVPHLELSLYSYGQVPDLSSMPSPRLLSTHLPLTSLPSSIIKGSDCKIVYLCREPKDAFISFWHFLNKRMPHVAPECIGDRPLDEAFDAFCKGVYWYGPFWDHVLGYWKESLEKPTKVLFLTYEAMKDMPALHLKRLAGFLGCPFSLEEEEDGIVERILDLCSFDNLSKLDVNKSGELAVGGETKIFFRKGEIGDWMNYLTPEMAQRIDKITREKLHGTGLNF